MNLAIAHSLRDLTAAGDAPPIGRVAREFESLIIGEMLKASTRPIGPPGPLDGGSGGRLAREQFLQEIARLAAARGGLGLAARLEQQIEPSDSAASEDR